MKVNTNNIFMEYIYKKMKLTPFNFITYFFNIIKLNKFKKEIYKSSPSFDILWQMADFIKLSELVFFYNNTPNIKNIDMKIGLYSSSKYECGTNGFKIFTPECDITIKLFSSSNKVSLDISRDIGEKRTTSMTFVNGQWKNDPDLNEEMLIEQVIKCINNRILRLFDYCYKLR